MRFLRRYESKSRWGHSGPLLDDSARGAPLPEDFADIIYHLGYM